MASTQSSRSSCKIKSTVPFGDVRITSRHFVNGDSQRPCELSNLEMYGFGVWKSKGVEEDGARKRTGIQICVARVNVSVTIYCCAACGCYRRKWLHTFTQAAGDSVVVERLVKD